MGKSKDLLDKFLYIALSVVLLFSLSFCSVCVTPGLFHEKAYAVEVTRSGEYLGVDYTFYSNGDCIIGKEGTIQTFDYDAVEDYDDIPWFYFEHEITGTLKFAGTVNILGSGENHESLSYFLDNLSNTKVIDFTNAHVEGVKDMTEFFGGGKLEEVIFGDNFDTSQVAEMNHPFCGSEEVGNHLKRISFGKKCTFENLDDWSYQYLFTALRYSTIEDLDISMFIYNCYDGDIWSSFSDMTSLKRIKLGSGTAKDMYQSFKNCSSLEEVYLGDIDFSSLESTKEMFSGCSSLENLDLNNMNTTNIKDMESMFSGCDSLKSVTFGEGWTKWIDNAYLPTPTGAGLTGKWVNEDKPELGAKTSEELYNELPANSVLYTGTWKAQTRSDILLEEINSIEYANVSTDGKDVSTEEYWTTQEDRDKIDIAVTNTETIIAADDENTDWDNVDTSLDAAINGYNAVKKRGTKLTEPSSGEETGSGKTDLTLQIISSDERGGAEDPNNPDDDNDGFGDVISFSVPTKVNFIAKPNGDLIAPHSSLVYLENESSFSIHASSLKVDSIDGWNIVEDASLVPDDGTSATKNNVSLAIKPRGSESGLINMIDYLEKKALTNSADCWNMTAAISGVSVISDRINLEFTGFVSNVTNDITTASKFAELHWYVTPGSLS